MINNNDKYIFIFLKLWSNRKHYYKYSYVLLQVLAIT